MTRDPHYLRVARALALITGLAGFATGCGGDDTSTPDGSMTMDGSGGGTDGGGGGTDGGGGGMDGGGGGTDGGEVTDGGEMADGGGDADGGGMNDGGDADGGTAIADAGIDCTACECFPMDSGLPACDGDALLVCGCAVIGPLFPPDMAV